MDLLNWKNMTNEAGVVWLKPLVVMLRVRASTWRLSNSQDSYESASGMCGGLSCTMPMAPRAVHSPSFKQPYPRSSPSSILLWPPTVHPRYRSTAPMTRNHRSSFRTQTLTLL